MSWKQSHRSSSSGRPGLLIGRKDRGKNPQTEGRLLLSPELPTRKAANMYKVTKYCTPHLGGGMTRHARRSSSRADPKGSEHHIT